MLLLKGLPKSHGKILDNSCALQGEESWTQSDVSLLLWEFRSRPEGDPALRMAEERWISVLGGMDLGPCFPLPGWPHFRALVCYRTAPARPEMHTSLQRVISSCLCSLLPAKSSDGGKCLAVGRISSDRANQLKISLQERLSTAAPDLSKLHSFHHQGRLCSLFCSEECGIC